MRIKLKIEPGWDVGPVRAVREHFGDDLLLQVRRKCGLIHWPTLGSTWPGSIRSNCCSSSNPFEREDLADAELANLIRSPICLDESITSARVAADAIRLGACRIVNIRRTSASAATLKLGGFMMCVPPTACQFGAEVCWKRGWAGR